MEELIRTVSLKAYYKIGRNSFVHAVDNVNLSIRKNEVIGIAGESGCGKSTLLKILVRDLKPPLTIIEGKVFYFLNNEKIDIYSLSESEFSNFKWKFFSFIPQSVMGSLNPTSKIKKIFEETIKAHNNISKEEAQNLIEETFENMGLSKELLKFYPHQLSGGMRQRVIIALAIIAKPKVIFCDEPTTGLDLVTQKGILQSLQDLQRELKNTLVLVSHDMGIHAQLTHRIAVMYGGKIVEFAPTESIFEKPYHFYTKALINSLPIIGDPSYKSGISGSPPSLIDPKIGCRFVSRCPEGRPECESKELPLIEIEPDHYISCLKYGG
ncbi:MAG: ABC transporter ATP-binding protein [Candidatus Methanomethylicaceae archaeon]